MIRRVELKVYTKGDLICTVGWITRTIEKLVMLFLKVWKKTFIFLLRRDLTLALPGLECPVSNRPALLCGDAPDCFVGTEASHVPPLSVWKHALPPEMVFMQTDTKPFCLILQDLWVWISGKQSKVSSHFRVSDQKRH